uniref:Reverse transcriptase domain-containing protein n=1 Tax=Stegastes partitus TaxID=144197 RepID=A0A3B5A470_9TELE
MLSRWFTIQRGIRQDDLQLAFLFIMYIDVLAAAIRQKKNISRVQIEGEVYKLALNADDIIIYFTQPEKSLPKLMETIYLGVNISNNLGDLFTMNYGILENKIRMDMNRWKIPKRCIVKIELIIMTIKVWCTRPGGHEFLFFFAWLSHWNVAAKRIIVPDGCGNKGYPEPFSPAAQ